MAAQRRRNHVSAMGLGAPQSMLRHNRTLAFRPIPDFQAVVGAGTRLRSYADSQIRAKAGFNRTNMPIVNNA